MKKRPEFLKVSYRDEIFKLRPAAVSFQDLVESLQQFIPNAPSHPLLTYRDEQNDMIKISSDRGLSSYYLDLESNMNLFLYLQHDFDEVIEKNKSVSITRSNEDDIINLSILGLVNINVQTLKTVNYKQTEFAKCIIAEILKRVQETSIELAAEEFQVSWEVIFFMTQQPGFVKKPVQKKIIPTLNKIILRPSKCYKIVQEFLKSQITKDEILNHFKISEQTFDLWLNLFTNPIPEPVELTHITEKEKLKLLSSYLQGIISATDLESLYKVSQSEISSWAIYYSKEEQIYQRERVVSAQEKQDLLQRYFNGEYTCADFQADYGVRGNIFYKWIKQLKSGKPLKESTLFRNASDELEQAYSIFQTSYR